MQLQTFADFFFPPQCAVCAAAGNGLCERCFPSMPPIRTRCASLQITALGLYDGALRKAIVALKGGRRDVARAFGERLSSLIAKNSNIVPVPTTAARKRIRGFDGCDLVARVAAGSHATVIAGLRQISGDTQRGRGRDARLSARGRFVWGAQPLCGRSVVLFDDVLTTGSTIADCVKAIHRAGGRVREAIVVAVVPDHGYYR